MLSELAQTALRSGGLLHLVQLPATLLLARELHRQRMLASMPPLVQRALQVVGGGILLLVFGGAVWCWLLPTRVIYEPFGIAFASGWAVFWLYRLVVQAWVYGPWMTRHRRVHACLMVVFAAKAACFTCAAAGAWLRLPRHHVVPPTSVPAAPEEGW